MGNFYFSFAFRWGSSDIVVYPAFKETVQICDIIVFIVMAI